VYAKLVSGLLFPLHEWCKGHDSVRTRRWFEQTQWWSRDQLGQLRLDRLKRLVNDACANVPYYRNVSARLGVSAEDIRSLDDLASWPFLTKALIRAHRDELKRDGCRDLILSNTGGSTGEPLQFFLGKERVSHDVAAKWRATRWWGMDIGDPEIVIWGSPIELGAQDWARLLRDALLRTRLLSAFEMSERKLDRFVEIVRRMRPKMVFGYPSALAHVARHAQARGQRMDDIGIKVAFVTAEYLYEEQRQQIGATFGCRVANGYGGRDAGFIAHECPHGGMHITAEDVIVEIVDNTGRVLPPGESGEVVVTHLASKDFPFIRYRTGDVAVLDASPCSCGRGLPLIKEIQGRATDFVIARDGTVIHGLALIYVVRDLPGIKQFKIIQESLEHTHVLVVASQGFEQASVEAVKSGITRRLGEGVRVSVELTDAIEPEKSGKYRYVISRVARF
jgi:phenylacetate-CoA ligase